MDRESRYTHYAVSEGSFLPEPFKRHAVTLVVPLCLVMACLPIEASDDTLAPGRAVLLSSRRGAHTLPCQRVVSPTAVYDLNYDLDAPGETARCFVIRSKIPEIGIGELWPGREGWNRALVAAPMSDSSTLRVLGLLEESAHWRYLLSVEVPVPSPVEAPVAAFGWLPSRHRDLRDSLIAVVSGDPHLYVFTEEKEGAEEAGGFQEADTPRMQLPELVFGTRPYFHSLSVDPKTGEVLVVHAPSSSASAECTLLILGSESAFHLGTVPLPRAARRPVFAVWYYVTEPGGEHTRGIVTPFGTDVHEGFLWTPLRKATNVLGEMEERRVLRVGDVADRSFRAGAVDDSTLYVAGNETGRLYAFDLRTSLEPVVQNVKNLQIVPIPGFSNPLYLCWAWERPRVQQAPEGATEWKLRPYCDGTLLTPEGVDVGAGGFHVKGLAPGSLVDIVACETTPSGEVVRCSTFPQTVRVPHAANWSMARLEQTTLFTVTAVTFDAETGTVILGNKRGELFCLPVAEVEDVIGEGLSGEYGEGELRPAPLANVVVHDVPESDDREALRLTACEFGPDGTIMRCDGWTGLLFYQGDFTRLERPLEGPAGATPFVADFALAHGAGPGIDDAMVVGQPGVIVADVAGSRLLELDVETGSLWVIRGVLPLEDVASPLGSGMAGAGPFGIASLGRELLFLWRHPRSGQLMLWSSYQPAPGMLQPAHPREVVPVPEGFVPTGLAVAETDRGSLLLVAGNSEGEPLLLGRRMREEHTTHFLSEVMDLKPGVDSTWGSFECSGLDEKRFSVVVSRLDVEGQHESAALHLTLTTPGGYSGGGGPYEMAFGDLLSQRAKPPDSSLLVSVTAESTCRIRLDVSASGYGTTCYYGVYPFVRGDVNAVDGVNLADPIALLAYLFAGGELRGCHDAADADDDGSVNIADAVRLLHALFVGTSTIAPPYPNCGMDPTEDTLPLCDKRSQCVQ